MKEMHTVILQQVLEKFRRYSIDAANQFKIEHLKIEQDSWAYMHRIRDLEQRNKDTQEKLSH